MTALHSTPEPRPQDEMGYWLAITMRDLREQAGIKRTQVAGLLRVSEAKIARFEGGVSWPRNPGELLAVYADLLGVGHTCQFWAEALRRWVTSGDCPPTAEMRDAARRAQDAARLAASRTKRTARAESS